MNAVEIEEAISVLAEQEFDAKEFPFAFLEAFGNKKNIIKRLRSKKSDTTNKSDIDGAVLQRNNIHILICDTDSVSESLTKLKESAATTKWKAKFVVATNGKDFEAEDIQSGETVACAFSEFPDHFGFFLPLAGISTVKQIRESSFDIKATGRLNKLYIELIKDNPEWGSAERRHDMNHFMARLIFCFFAEDTDIFNGEDLFTATIQQMSERDSSNTHEIMSEVFRAMDTPFDDRESASLPRWTEKFPYVNGGLFSDDTDVPKFSKIARSYLLHIGSLDWTKINPDIFGSMIQAVTDEEERGSLGLHYTSVPNILKVLNPLFLDDLKEKLEEASDNHRKLLNLRNRMAKIRVFDPACGSGNFLVISYKEMREIENEINHRRGEPDRKTDIPLTNFRGIELRDFPAEIARLALIIAEYQCDVLYRGQKEALDEFLPLDEMNWIVCGNALRLDWLSICPPTGTGVKVTANDLFETPLEQAEIDFENEGGETYICGNPPYKGSNAKPPKNATAEQKEKFKAEEIQRKEDLKAIFDHRTNNWKSLDYVAGWFMKAADFGMKTESAAALVSTNSICQGRQVETLWSLILNTGHNISFAHTSFKWANLASHNAGVTVVIVGISTSSKPLRQLYSMDDESVMVVKETKNINPYLISGKNIMIQAESKPLNGLSEMNFGNMPNDGGFLLLTDQEAKNAMREFAVLYKYIRPFYGSQEFIKGQSRFCIWVEDGDLEHAKDNVWLSKRFESVRQQRLESSRKTTQLLADKPHSFGEIRQRGTETIIAVPAISSENREYLPCGILPVGSVLSNKCYGLFDAPLWNLSLIFSRLHWVWIGTVCVRMRTDFSYSNTLGWNTFPLPKLTEKNKDDLLKCAEEVLLARESHYPATIADLYDPETMPKNLRLAHEKNDEVLERIYIGRKFKNDTERLEKLFELYTKMTADSNEAGTSKKKVF